MEQETRTEMNYRPERRSGNGELRSLLRSRWVQGVLVLTASMQLTAALSRGGSDEASREDLAVLPPATVVAPDLATLAMGGENVSEMWRTRAVERESQRLAAQYQAKGYRVSDQLAKDIVEAALKHEIDPEIAFGLVRAESSFRNHATSVVGATGLTQLMPRTAAWMEPGVTRAQLRDQKTNLDIGFKYLRYLTDKYDGNTDLALLAYNRGPGTVDRALRRGANPDNGYAAFVRGEEGHGHRLFTR